VTVPQGSRYANFDLNMSTVIGKGQMTYKPPPPP